MHPSETHPTNTVTSQKKQLTLWWLAIRPRTLSLSAIPVCVGTILAWQGGATAVYPNFIVALLCAVLIQAGTNLFNDANDFIRGNDGPTRLGPIRVTAAGLATPYQVKRAAKFTFLLALLGGCYLVIAGGLPTFIIGLASIITGWKYSGGSHPLSHTAWGEFFVLLFFGIIAVAGSHYLQSKALSFPALLTGILLGAHAAAVLLVNNVRDLEPDRLAGRKTLAASLGLSKARYFYAFLMLVPFPLLILLSVLLKHPPIAWIPLIALPLCLWLSWRYQTLPPSIEMNRQLTLTAQAQMLLGLLLSIALIF